jgi:hypothetical protein
MVEEEEKRRTWDHPFEYSSDSGGDDSEDDKIANLDHLNKKYQKGVTFRLNHWEKETIGRMERKRKNPKTF